MISLRDFLSLRRVSFLILVMPFLVDFIISLYIIDKLPYLNLLILLVSIIIFDYTYLIVFKKLEKRILLFALIHAFLLLFFYYSYFLLFFVTINEHTVNFRLRAKYILPEIFGIITYLIYRSRFKLRNTFYILNIFFLSLCFIKILDRSNSFNVNKKNIKNHPITFHQNKGNPIILIITDEYASPIELMNNFKDSTIFNHKKYLLSKKWIVKDHMYTADTLTINSLASLFNFNLQSSDKFLSIPFSKEKLRSSSLYDSLEKKKVKFYNYGIVDIGNSKAMTKIYFILENEMLKRNFFTSFFTETLINPLLNNYNDFDSLQIKHNKLNIEKSKNNLSNIEDNSFVYIHLLMPHAPYEYKGIKHSYKDLASTDKLDNYYNYWKFSNKILTTLLLELTKESKYRIILTGDHGFRGDIRINPHYTFTAFYGFDSTSIKYINSVQDIGSLINSGY